MDGLVHVWRGCECVQTLEHPDDVRCIAFSSNNRKVATGATSGVVRIWDVETGECRELASRHGRDVATVVFNSGTAAALRECLLTGSWDHTAKLWDCQRGVCLATLAAHTAVVRCVAFSACGRVAATGSDDGTARVWDTAAGIEFWRPKHCTTHCVVLQAAVWSVLLAAQRCSVLTPPARATSGGRGGGLPVLPPEMWLEILGFLQSSDFPSNVFAIRWREGAGTREGEGKGEGEGEGGRKRSAMDATVRRRRGR